MLSSPDIGEARLRMQSGRIVAHLEEKVAELLNGGSPRKVIVVPGRLVNVVL